MKCELCKLDPLGQCTFCRMRQEVIKNAREINMPSRENYFAKEQNIGGEYGGNEKGDYSKLNEMLQEVNSYLGNVNDLKNNAVGNYPIMIINNYGNCEENCKKNYGEGRK